MNINAEANSGDHASPTLSSDQYKSLLDRWINHFEDLPPESCCARPPDWNEQITVEAGSRHFRVPLRFLDTFTASKHTRDNDGDDKSESEQRVDALAERLASLHALRAALDENTRLRPRDAASAADAVLSAREFRAVHPPGLKESLWDKLLAWLSRMLGKLSGKTPDTTLFSRILIWLTISSGVVIAGVLVKRLLQATEQSSSGWRLGGRSSFVSSKSHAAWLAEARAAAAENRWEDAVRCAYWALISALEASGAWRPDVARTPREYLRLLAANHPASSALDRTTRRFEAICYAKRDASETDFEDAVGSLAEIGYR